jgi:hypothetical protein
MIEQVLTSFWRLAALMKSPIKYREVTPPRIFGGLRFGGLRTLSYVRQLAVLVAERKLRQIGHFY